jgi:predicted transcriptional regulator of viral defense system
MLKLTTSAAILGQLAEANRRVLSDWHALVFLRRASLATPPGARRWRDIPDSLSDVHLLLRQMVARGELRPVLGLSYLYEVTTPYARKGVIDEEEILMETHPFAAISYLSALVYHGLTDDLPQQTTVMIPRTHTGGLLPPGTFSTDWQGWQGISVVRGRTPARILGRPVQWIRIPAGRYFGIRDYQPNGYPVRVTTPERTLVDGLEQSALCGGLENVLQAWSRAQDTLDIDGLVEVVEQFNIAVLRQRVGFILDELDIKHPRVERWRATARRGGSSKLVADAPYAPTYSERWNLSINAPITALAADTA